MDNNNDGSSKLLTIYSLVFGRWCIHFKIVISENMLHLLWKCFHVNATEDFDGKSPLVHTMAWFSGAWVNVEPDPCRHMASLIHNQFKDHNVANISVKSKSTIGKNEWCNLRSQLQHNNLYFFLFHGNSIIFLISRFIWLRTVMAHAGVSWFDPGPQCPMPCQSCVKRRCNPTTEDNRWMFHGTACCHTNPYSVHWYALYIMMNVSYKMEMSSFWWNFRHW